MGELPRKITRSDGIIFRSTRLKKMRHASRTRIVSPLPAIIGLAGTTNWGSFK